DQCVGPGADQLEGSGRIRRRFNAVSLLLESHRHDPAAGRVVIDDENRVEPTSSDRRPRAPAPCLRAGRSPLSFPSCHTDAPRLRRNLSPLRAARAMPHRTHGNFNVLHGADGQTPRPSGAMSRAAGLPATVSWRTPRSLATPVPRLALLAL